jgi:hypothetical protein
MVIMWLFCRAIHAIADFAAAQAGYWTLSGFVSLLALQPAYGLAFAVASIIPSRYSRAVILHAVAGE